MGSKEGKSYCETYDKKCARKKECDNQSGFVSCLRGFDYGITMVIPSKMGRIKYWLSFNWGFIKSWFPGNKK